MTLNHATFKNNTANQGGAIYNCKMKTLTLNKAIFSGNSATLMGGAIYNEGIINLQDSVVLGGKTDDIYNPESGEIKWDLTNQNTGKLFGYEKLQNAGGKLSLIVNKKMKLGEYVIATGDFSSVKGKNTFDVKVDAKTSTTITIGGDIVTFEGADYALSIIDTTLVLTVAEEGSLKSKRSEVTSENSPYDLGDGVIYLNSTYTVDVAGDGGGVLKVEENASATGSNLTFKNNKAVQGKTIGSGGAISNSGTLTLTGSTTFTDNNSQRGGAIYQKSGSVTLQDTTVFTNNTATSFGGVIYAFSDATLTFGKQAIFNENKATGTSSKGGALYCFSSSLTFNEGAIFNGNATPNNPAGAGAINNSHSTISFAGTMDLKTATDTWVNIGDYNQTKQYATVNWNLTGGLAQYGSITHFEHYSNQSTKVETNDEYLVNQLITINTDQEPGEYVIASGDMSDCDKDVTGKYKFFVTNGVKDTFTIQVGGAKKLYGKNFYSLAINKSKLLAKAADKQLVLSVEPMIVVTYDLQGHGDPIKNDTIASGSKLTKPTQPVATGLKFTNWYTEPECINRFDFDKSVKANQDTTITLYAYWKDQAKYDQFLQDLMANSYVEYDSIYKAGFRIHLATKPDEQVYLYEPDSMYQIIEYSASVAEYVYMPILMYTFYASYPQIIDEYGKCSGGETTDIMHLLANYTALPVRSTGNNAVYMVYTYPIDIIYKTWIDTNYNNDADFCQCIFNSDIILKDQAHIMDKFQEGIIGK